MEKKDLKDGNQVESKPGEKPDAEMYERVQDGITAHICVMIAMVLRGKVPEVSEIERVVKTQLDKLRSIN
jgi:hypothetical protein